MFVILSFLSFSSCKGQNNPDCLVNLEEKLSPKVNEENKMGEVINLRNDADCFEWDTLIVQMAISNKEMTEKTLRIKIPFDYNYSWGADSTAMLLFVKNNTVVHYILQKPTVSRETFDQAKSIKAYNFIQLLNNYGNGGYAKIPKEKAVFETYPMIYHDENGKEITNPKYGLGIKVKE
jgi:hypothetical protein